MQISARIESGIVRLRARVPIRDDVRKQPLPQNKQKKLLSIIYPQVDANLMKIKINDQPLTRARETRKELFR